MPTLIPPFCPYPGADDASVGVDAKAAGVTNTPANVGLVLSIIFLVLSVLVWIGLIATGALSYALNPMG